MNKISTCKYKLSKLPNARRFSLIMACPQSRRTARHSPRLAALQPGDTLVIWKLDRAFRSTVDAILALESFRKRGIEFRCLTMHIDTSTPEGRKWYRDTASWAEYERELISQRTKAGMAAARRRGVRLGRPRKLTANQVAEARAAIASGEESCGEVAARMGVDVVTLRRALRDQRQGDAPGAATLSEIQAP